ncbi:hypothetical protein ACFW04_009103 [Cataglyphis niger]
MIDNESFRLPKEVKPIHYDLILHPIFKKYNYTFSGKVTILIDVLDDRRTIALHRKDLNIKSAKLITYGLEENYEIKISSISNPTRYEIFVISTKNKFKSGLYKLSLEFCGDLDDKIVGFYSSKYEYYDEETLRKIEGMSRREKLPDKQISYIATTKFEPTYARQAFPCFDEPNFKAEFSIKLICPMENSYDSLSNMNIESVELDKPHKDLKTITFAQTVPMSTYLVCFIVSNMVKSTMMAKGLNGQEFPVSVYSTKVQTKEKRQFPLHIGVKAIEYYIKLFEIDYPLPKLDMVAIPDFVSGAMENWGLITYREARLLYDEHNNSIIDKHNVVNVICHELAHMWFGNLVTLSWWNDLWLNEGFATFLSYKSANEILPNQKYMEQFIVDVMHKVMITDAKLSSHPIIQNLKNPDEITSFFDEISYQKGAAIIRMMENFIGPDVFYNAISTYLNKYAYLNAETADFFNILQDAVGNKLNITAIMDPWMRQEGYPIIIVKKINNKFILYQKRFVMDPNIPSKYNPPGYKSNKSSADKSSADKSSADKSSDESPDDDRLMSILEIDVDEHTKWIKLNVNQVGYYRVNYGDEWSPLKKLLQFHPTRLSTADRANILDDIYSLAMVNSEYISKALTISFYLLHQEYHASPWAIASSKILSIYILCLMSLETEIDTKYNLQIFGLKLVENIYKDVTWTVKDTIEYDGPFSIDKEVRIIVLDFACALEHKECLKEAGRIFMDWLTLRKMPHPDIRELVYYYGMRYVSKEDDWYVMFQNFKDETDPIEKNKIMKGLAGIKSTEILKEYINLATNEQNVRTQDFLRCLIMISENPDGTSLVWDWVRGKWEWLVRRYTLNDRYLGELIPAITKSFATEIKLQEMKNFFKQYPNAGAGANSRAKALNTVSWNIRWLSEAAKEINLWYDDALTKEKIFL